MIKFFGRIRRKLITEGSLKRYLVYAIGEILLVMVGILLALQVNNWNENNKSTREINKILQDLKTSISTDTQQLKIKIEWGADDIESSNVILKYLENDLAYHDSLNKHFMLISGAGLRKYFSPQTSAYKVLESKGINLISNEKLRKQILDLYNIEYPRLNYEYDNYRHNILDYGRPIARSQFIVEGDVTPYMRPIDYEQLSVSPEFYNTVKTLKFNNSLINKILAALVTRCQEIETMIDSELKK